MKKLACELTDEEREIFVEAFYEAMPSELDDRFPESPNPWGCPWNYQKTLILIGNSLEEMAKNYAKKVQPHLQELFNEKCDVDTYDSDNEDIYDHSEGEE